MSRMGRFAWISAATGLALLGWVGAASAQASDSVASTAELKKLSVEELMDIEVTSVSKQEESLGSAAATVAVVTGEDIHRAGATSLPEALRGVPGLHVASTGASAWAVSSRGFSSVNSEKLLVLSDTRSIYTPLYSGVFWDVQDYLLQDIDRIEVIRGPGAALWGSNAVNGVINITTKSARDTQGAYFEAGAGDEERAVAAARYGGETAGGIYYRVFGQYRDRDASFNPNAISSDDWQLGHIGFRADWDRTVNDAVTLQGDLYDGDIGRLAPSISLGGPPNPAGRLRTGVSGGNILGRWQHRAGDNAELQLRAYYDRTHRNDPNFRDDLDTVDLDLQHRFPLGARQEATWGLNYRYTSNRNEGKVIFNLDPRSSHDRLASGFVQDRIALSDSLRVTLGTKLEHNDFSGFEVQPSGRLAWDFAPRQTLWSAVSRAVRVPTRLERDIAIDASDPAGNPVVRLLGNRDFDSEKLLAYELGYRWQALTALSIDLAAFHNRYHGLASLELGQTFIDPRDGKTVMPIINRNLTDGRAEGIEALVNWSPRSFWRLSVSYAYLDLELDPHGADLNHGRFAAGATPRNQFGLRSFLDLPGNFAMDAFLRHLDDIRQIPQIVTGTGLPGYTELDLRFAWRGWRSLELSLTGRDLLHAHHHEFGAPASSGDVERSMWGKIAWGF